MGLVNGIWLALLGVLAVPSLLLSRRPDAKEMLAKIQPFQGWMGVVSACWGVFGIISSVLHLNMIAHWPILWATFLADSVLLAALGFLLGMGTMKMFIKDPTAQAKMDETMTKLAPHQGRLGLIGVGVGVWMVVASLLWRM
jgi:hypothetical protein